jgi:Cdc6-like AAA superfamily ATPase
MKTSNSASIVERMVIPHTAFAEARQRIEQCFAFSAAKAEAEGLAIVGESGTGKTSVLKSFQSNHMPTRSPDGMEIPILYASVPPMPTVKSLAGVMLAALNAPDSERGTENEKSKRLRVLMRETGTRMVMIDEFQHFYDRGKRQIMLHVADWLKVLIDETRSTLVVAGLPSCRVVINENEQLARRFMASIQLPRFAWTDPRQRGEFISILEEYHNQIAKDFKVPALHSDEMAFRFFLATGGLMGYLSKLLRTTLRDAAERKRASISLEDLNVAHARAMWFDPTVQEQLKPFERGFRPEATVDALNRASRIGTVTDLPQRPTPRRVGVRKAESINADLVAA